MEITFINGLTLADSKDPYFLGDRGIDGYVSLTDATAMGFDVVKISLEGLSSTFTITHAKQLTRNRHLGELFSVSRLVWGYCPPKAAKGMLRDYPCHQSTATNTCSQLLELNTIKKPRDFNGTEEQSKRPPRCFFHFDILKSLQSHLLEQENGFLGDLPASMPRFEPTIRHPVLQPRCSGDSLVSYKVRAQAFRQNDLLSSCIGHVKIIPSLDPRPPICVTDFPGEYNMAMSSCRKKWIPGASGTRGLRIEALPPEPVVLASPTDVVSLSTCLKLTQMGAPTQGSRQQRPQDVVTGQCKARLTALTFISSTHRQNAPTQKDLASERGLSQNTYICAKGQVGVHFSEWREVSWSLRGKRHSGRHVSRAALANKLPQDESHANPDTMTHWQTEGSLTLQLKSTGPAYFVPSFESSLLSRRYKLDLDVRISVPRQCRFHLTLPVQIVYRTDHAGILTEVATECPPYVR